MTGVPFTDGRERTARTLRFYPVAMTEIATLVGYAILAAMFVPLFIFFTFIALAHDADAWALSAGSVVMMAVGVLGVWVTVRGITKTTRFHD